MKKLLLLLSIATLASCSCLMSQVPPQLLYVDANCQALIPDYTEIVIASDNCGEVALSQIPLPGYLMTVSNPVENVVVTATDLFGNTTTMTINVTLIDTIPPILEWPAGQVAMTEQGLIDIYKNWEAGVKVQGIAHWIYDQSWTQGMPFADSTQIEENLKYFTNVIKLTDEEYSQYLLYMESNF